jgi:hypothetical protein
MRVIMGNLGIWEVMGMVWKCVFGMIHSGRDSLGGILWEGFSGKYKMLLYNSTVPAVITFYLKLKSSFLDKVLSSA